MYSEVHQWLLQSPAVSASGAAFCRRAYGHTIQPRYDSSSSSEDDDEDEVNQAPVPAATTSAASESAAVPAAATFDDSREVCLVAPRVGFILVPCGHARFCESCVIRSHYFRLTKHVTILIYSKIHAQITKKTITK